MVSDDVVIVFNWFFNWVSTSGIFGVTTIMMVCFLSELYWGLNPWDTAHWDDSHRNWNEICEFIPIDAQIAA
jgi:hypothetical protein